MRPTANPRPSLCAWCKEPLTPQPGRGRPRQTHPGDCATAWKRARDARNRRELFQREHSPAYVLLDLPQAPLEYDDDESAYTLPGFRTGYSEYDAVVDEQTYLDNKLALQDRREAMEAWEKSRAALNKWREEARQRWENSTPEERAAFVKEWDATSELTESEYLETFARNPDAKPSPAYLAHKVREFEIHLAEEIEPSREVIFKNPNLFIDSEVQVEG